MTWRSLLSRGSDLELILPWYGRREVHSEDRTWVIQGVLPPTHGWHLFLCKQNRYCVWREEAIAPLRWGKSLHGYLVGGRFISPRARAELDPRKLIDQTEPVELAPDYLDWLTGCRVYRDRGGSLVYVEMEMLPLVAYDILSAMAAKKDIGELKGVTPALELAFLWWSREKKLQEERRRQLQLEREREEQRHEFLAGWKGAQERRKLAETDFGLAAEEALKISGAELLDTRRSSVPNEMVVQYRIRNRMFECVVDKNTLAVIDAGICLTDESTGEKGDSLLTLESLPGVTCEAIDAGRLVVWRRV